MPASQCRRCAPWRACVCVSSAVSCAVSICQSQGPVRPYSLSVARRALQRLLVSGDVSWSALGLTASGALFGAVVRAGRCRCQQTSTFQKLTMFGAVHRAVRLVGRQGCWHGPTTSSAPEQRVSPANALSLRPLAPAWLVARRPAAALAASAACSSVQRPAGITRSEPHRVRHLTLCYSHSCGAAVSAGMSSTRHANVSFCADHSAEEVDAGASLSIGSTKVQPPGCFHLPTVCYCAALMTSAGQFRAPSPLLHTRCCRILKHENTSRQEHHSW
jgi:hypothetical protein